MYYQFPYQEVKSCGIKAWLFVSKTLFRFTHGTRITGSKHSNYYREKMCAFINEHLCENSFFQLFIWKLLKLSLLSFPSQLAKTFPKSIEHVMFVCEWVSPKYYKDTIQVLQTKRLTKLTSVTQHFNKLSSQHLLVQSQQ